MTLEQVDILICIVDIFLSILDIGLIIYLFFYRFPPEKKKKRYDKFGYYRHKNRKH